ncbi:hypothetical protein [Roseomonas xinghualingensis]|uniref:hypothetical protein n=1 Tax=Roseomonas xinghualingensis TaxID=2986475 RepID=UPI0021F231BF|nr:hypothetical protein [Roseomonas sp. SXEYE001]MCV4207388.1 hypothetical protein [Roseomonas sp. SXEYE001]
MPRRPALIPALVLLALAQPAMAQGQLRSVVVPAEGGVVIPPRSAPRLTVRPTGTGAPLPPSMGPAVLPNTGMGVAAPIAGLILPAIAGALIGGTIAGSGGGSTSGPARTR